MTQLSSRPPFNDDPYPNVWAGHSEHSQMRADTNMYRKGAPDSAIGSMVYVTRPRPEFDRPQTNPTNLILDDLRDYWKHHGPKLTARHAAAYIDICDYEGMDVPAEHIAHAREVLTRLAAFDPDWSAA